MSEAVVFAVTAADLELAPDFGAVRAEIEAAQMSAYIRREWNEFWAPAFGWPPIPEVGS